MCGLSGLWVCSVMLASGEKTSCCSYQHNVSMCGTKYVNMIVFPESSIRGNWIWWATGPGGFILFQADTMLVWFGVFRSRQQHGWARIHDRHAHTERKQPHVSPRTEQSFYQHPLIRNSTSIHEQHSWLRPGPTLWLVRYDVCWWTHIYTQSFLHRWWQTSVWPVSWWTYGPFRISSSCISGWRSDMSSSFWRSLVLLCRLRTEHTPAVKSWPRNTEWAQGKGDSMSCAASRVVERCFGRRLCGTGEPLCFPGLSWLWRDGFLRGFPGAASCPPAIPVRDLSECSWGRWEILLAVVSVVVRCPALGEPCKVVHKHRKLYPWLSKY